uniref:Uncharacterized protein n=1 Tax=Ascaris lumbricoides TaxID=6252 RepID=A0A0M3HVW3_ASCLU
MVGRKARRNRGHSDRWSQRLLKSDRFLVMLHYQEEMAPYSRLLGGGDARSCRRSVNAVSDEQRACAPNYKKRSGGCNS